MTSDQEEELNVSVQYEHIRVPVETDSLCVCVRFQQPPAPGDPCPEETPQPPHLAAQVSRTAAYRHSDCDLDNLLLRFSHVKHKLLKHS